MISSKQDCIDSAYAYSYPVNQLLTLGSCKNKGEWPESKIDYSQIEITEAHIPELIQMATDPMLLHSEADNDSIWAPIHAWRMLGLLKAEQAIEPLTNLFEECHNCDWACEELPEVMAMIGGQCIPALQNYLFDNSKPQSARINANVALRKVGLNIDPERKKCVDIFSAFLDQADDETPTLNGFVISSLVRMEAVEAIESIRHAFHRDIVELFIAGDLEQVEILMGLRQPKPRPKSQVRLPTRTPLQPIIRENKIGRNAPCHCGSGKKYKKCCYA